MPITKSAKKALRQNIKRRLQNLKIKNQIREIIKRFRSLVLQKKVQEAKSLYPQLSKVVDKAVKKNVIKKNKASRIKSRLSLFLLKHAGS